MIRKEPILKIDNVRGQNISCDERLFADGHKWSCAAPAVALVFWVDDAKYLCQAHYEEARRLSNQAISEKHHSD